MGVALPGLFERTDGRAKATSTGVRARVAGAECLPAYLRAVAEWWVGGLGGGNRWKKLKPRPDYRCMQKVFVGNERSERKDEEKGEEGRGGGEERDEDKVVVEEEGRGGGRSWLRRGKGRGGERAQGLMEGRRVVEGN